MGAKSVFDIVAGSLKNSAARRMERAQDQGYTEDLYHGTHSDFDSVDPDKVDLGIHLGTDQQANNRLKDTRGSGSRYSGDNFREGANIIPVKARLGKSLEMSDVGDWSNSNQVFEGLRHNKAFNSDDDQFLINNILEEIDQLYAEMGEDFLQSPENRMMLDEARNIIKGKGYNSIKYLNEVENNYGSGAGITKAGDARSAELREQVKAIDDGVRARMPKKEAPPMNATQEQIENYISYNPLDFTTSAETKKRDALMTELNGVFDNPKYQQDPNSYISLDPSNVRSKYAQFNDGESDNLLASVGTTALGAVFTASALAPQDAEAGPVANAIHIGQRIIDLGMLKADSINNPRAIKLATNKYNKLMKENEAFADRERKAYANGFETIFNPTELPPRKIITPEDLQGKTIAPVRGDRSDLGHLTQVGGQKVDVDVQAGKKFTRQNGGWASAEGIAQGQHAKLVDAAEATQNDVVGVYNAMGEDSVNFSTPIAQGMFQQIPALQKLDLADVKKFDEEVRAFKKTTKKKDGTTVVSYPMKDWVGLDHPEAMSQIMGKDGYPQHGALRTVLTTTMKKAHYRDRGFPSYEEMVKAVEDPELAGANYGDSGISTYNVDASKGIEPIDYHDSYSHRMPGDDNGGLEQSLPFEVFFPESYKRYRNTKTRSGKLMTHDQAIVAMNIRKDGYEVADQKWLDGVEKYKAEIAAGTITAGFAGSAAAAEPDTGEKNYDAIYAERDARNTMSPRERKHAPRASKALRDHTLSTMLPSFGNAVQGVIETGAETLDYLNPVNLIRLQYDPANEGLSRFTAPSIVSPVSNLVDPVVKPLLYDEDDPEAVERAEKAKEFGKLFSPI